MQDKEEGRSENLSLVRRMIDVDSNDDVDDSNVDSYDSDNNEHVIVLALHHYING